MRKTCGRGAAWCTAATGLLLAAFACEQQAAAAAAKVLGDCTSACTDTACAGTCTAVGDLCTANNKADVMGVGTKIDVCDGQSTNVCPSTANNPALCVTGYQCKCVAAPMNAFKCDKGDKTAEGKIIPCKKPAGGGV